MAEGKESESKYAEDKAPQWEQIDYERDIELGEQIGGGGVGVIFAGRFKGRPVALKTLFDPKVDDSLMKEYMDELLVMSSLDHENIVSFMGACMTPPHICFVMELCDASLYDMLHKRRENFTTYERVQISVDVAMAMKYLHGRNPVIIHRDLKSHNLLISRGIVKLCDFGLVKTKVTQAGTPAYMAPELLTAGPFNKSVDVYSFGILLWEIFAQEIPFSGYDLDDLRRSVVRGERPRVPNLDTPHAIKSMMQACWSQNPSERPDFFSLEQELIDLLRDTPQHSELENLDASGFGGDALDDLLGGNGK